MAAVFDPAVFDPTVFEASADMAASGTLSLSGQANLVLTVEFAAAGTLALTSAPSLTTDIRMTSSDGILVVSGEAALRTGKTAGRVSDCGGVVGADCEQWALAPFQRPE